MHDLDGDLAVELDIVGEVDRGHASRAQSTRISYSPRVMSLSRSSSASLICWVL